MTFWYTARAPFGERNQEEGKTWDSYIDWYSLPHLKEMISLDQLLNEPLVEPDYNNADDWKSIVTDEERITELFTTIEYVLKRTKKARFNLLAVVKEPKERCDTVQLEEFEFIGYDILDKWYDVSSLTNCTGLNSSLEQADFNQSGLISNYERAFTIRKEFFEKNPGEPHADCYVMALWRHKTLGKG
jgi:hypothetical protein